MKCDKHGWMGAWILVLPHPFHDATGRSGTFELPKLPPGSYRLVAWHGELGSVERAVVLREGEVMDVELAFGAAR